MSFDALNCDHCGLYHWLLPRFYFRNEDGEIEIAKYPHGSEPYFDCLGYIASEAVRNNGSGQVSTWYCQRCQQISDIADVDEKQCSKCGTEGVVDLSTLEGKLCPQCGVCYLTKVDSTLSI